MNETPSTHRIRLPHCVIVKATGLLPMLYIPHELAEELGIAQSTLRDWMEFGAPYERDSRNRLWIHGVSFAAWVKAQQKHERSQKLARDEAYCLHCKQVTKLVSPETRHIKGYLVLIKGTCSLCGCVINRGDRYDRTTKLP